MPCRALGAFGLIAPAISFLARQLYGLNALSGIGCVRTTGGVCGGPPGNPAVLMPCRALGAFGRVARDCRPHYRPVS